MYEHLKGKKLLIIGSDPGNLPIVNAAHDMGIYVIVVDGITDYSYATSKKAADEAWDIDYSDTEAIVERAKNAAVDGVIAGYSEFRVLAACRIAEKLGLPFYANEEQINITRNKRTFKDLCVRYDIPIPKDYCFGYPMMSEDKEIIKYPVIVKPADYAGRKGISVCNSREDLDKAIEYAVSMSQSKTIIVEDYLEGIEFASIYTLSDGEISLSAVNEKYITDDQVVKTGLCEFLISPARSYNRYITELDGKLRQFIKGINAENGVIFFQGMVTDKKIYVFEMGYRLNGNNDFAVIDKYNNLNYMKMLIAYSLCGSMCDDLSKDNPLLGQYVSTLLFYAHSGTIGKMEYNKLYNHPAIADIRVSGWEGKKISEDGSTGQRILSLRISADTIDELPDIVKFVQNNVIVEDINGKNMLFKPFDSTCLLKN